MTNSANIFGYPDPEGCRKALQRLLIAFGLITFLIIAVCSLSSCKSVKPCIPTIEYRTNDSIAHHYHHDTTRIYERDSVIIHEKGDTVIIERWRDRWRDRVVIQKDSTSDNNNEQQVQTVEVVPIYYRRCSWALWILVVAIILFIVAKILIRIYVKR